MSATPSPTSPGRGFVLTVGGLVMLSALATDIALPAQPRIAQALEAGPETAPWVVSAYLAGFAVGQLLWGVLADRFGRRPVILGGLIAFTLMSLACALAPTMPLLLLARLCQGVSGGVGPVLARAVVRDLGGDRQGAALMSMMTAIVGIGPLLAPLLASGMLTVLDWRALFLFTVVYAAALIVLALRYLPETLAAEDRGGLGLARMIRNARRFLGLRQSLGGLLLVALPFGGYLTVIATSSIVLYDVYGISAALFGPIFAIAAVGFTGGSLVSRRLVGGIGMRRMLGIGVAVLAVASAALAIALLILPVSLIWLWGGVTLYILGVGMILPNATMIALEPVPDMAGYAASLMGLFQLAFGAGISALAGAVYNGTPLAFLAALSLCGALSCVVFWWFRGSMA